MQLPFKLCLDCFSIGRIGPRLIRSVVSLETDEEGSGISLLVGTGKENFDQLTDGRRR
jgi:hypothetical protein